MIATEAELWWDGRHGLGESVRWFDGAYHWVDIDTGAVLRGRDGDEPERTELGSTVSAVFPAGAGCEGVVAGDRIVVLEAGAVVAEHPLPDSARTHGRTNDARVDPSGRLWTGTVGTGAASRSAVLWRLDAGGPVIVRSELTLSNGLAFDGAGGMYHADTFDGLIHYYTLASDGAVTAARPYLRIDGLPDGLCLDAHGGLWVALWGGGRVERYDRDGRRTHVIRTPGASQVTSLCFGGASLDEIIITTAAEDVAEPRGGALFRAHVGLQGLPETAWSGFGEGNRTS